MLFDAVNDDSVSVPNQSILTDFAYSTWFVQESGDTGHRHLSYGLDALRYGGMQSGRAKWYDGSSYKTSADIGLNDGKLHHAVYIKQGTSMLVYVDGELVISDTFSVYTVGRLDSIVGHSARYFTGYINEVSIFDTALTADEVSELYNNGTALDATTHSKVDNLQGYWRNDGDDVWVDRTPVLGADIADNQGLDATWASWNSNHITDISNGMISLTAGATGLGIYSNFNDNLTTTTLRGGSSYEITFDAKVSSHLTETHSAQIHAQMHNGGTTVSQDISNTEWQTFTIVPTTDGSSDYLNIRNLSHVGMTAYLRNISVKEVKGGNDGTVSGSPDTILLPEARNGRDTMGMPINNVNNGYLALHGDGYVEVADDASLDFGTGDFTVELWFKGAETGSWRWLLSVGESSSSHIIIAGTGGQLRTSVGAWFTDVTTGTLTQLNDDDWYHVILTRKDGVVYTYLDGEVEGTASGVANTADLNANGTWIGRMNSAANQFNGSIDEPRIYNRALTEVEILQNYNAGKSKHRND
jgi:hypothetical protein